MKYLIIIILLSACAAISYSSELQQEPLVIKIIGKQKVEDEQDKMPRTVKEFEKLFKWHDHKINSLIIVDQKSNIYNSKINIFNYYLNRRVIIEDVFANMKFVPLTYVQEYNLYCSKVQYKGDTIAIINPNIKGEFSRFKYKTKVLKKLYEIHERLYSGDYTTSEKRFYDTYLSYKASEKKQILRVLSQILEHK